jgi:ribonuclease HII
MAAGEEAAMTGLPDFSFEAAALARGLTRICGVDEAGRGPLCGPVVAAAVTLVPGAIPEGLDDSKKLTAKRREALFDRIRLSADVGIGIASVEEVDRLNILRASHVAMTRAIAALGRTADHVLIDGNLIPRGLSVSAEAIVKGDARSLSISAASIIAKVTRDRIMVDLAQQHPGYGWERNAGYGTKDHLEALRNLGVTPHHRRSFKPIHNILYQDN